MKSPYLSRPATDFKKILEDADAGVLIAERRPRRSGLNAAPTEPYPTIAVVSLHVVGASRIGRCRQIATRQT